MLTKIPKFRRCVIQSFPFIEEDFDALTDYELLCKVVEYLNKVIDSQNDVADEVNDLSTSFQQLHDYVEHYFDNLDVQEEINNKIDEMVENGSFQVIFNNYVGPQLETLNHKIDLTEASLEDQINNKVDQEANSRLSADGSLQAQISGLASGSPLVASSTTGMTDTSKVYVNTTDGKWYYYDGDSWEIGGTYQTSGIGNGSVPYEGLTEIAKARDYKILQATDLIWQDKVNYYQGTFQTNSTDITTCNRFRVSEGTVIQIASIFKCRLTFWDTSGAYVSNTGTYAEHASTTVAQDGWCAIGLQANPATETFVDHTNITNANVVIKGLRDNRFEFISLPLVFNYNASTHTIAESNKIYVGSGSVVKLYGASVLNYNNNTQDNACSIYVKCFDRSGNVIVAQSADYSMTSNYTVGQDCYIQIITKQKNAWEFTDEILADLPNMFEIDYVLPTNPPLINKNFTGCYVGSNGTLEYMEGGYGGTAGHVAITWDTNILVNKGSSTAIIDVTVAQVQALFPDNALSYGGKQWIDIPQNQMMYVDLNDDTLKIGAWKTANMSSNVYPLFINAYQNVCGGALYELYLKKAVPTSQIFNSSPYSPSLDWKTPAKAFSKLLNSTGTNIETFTFFTDQHLMLDETGDYLATLPERIGSIQKVYNSVPMNFIVSGGDWLNDDDTVDQACFKLGYVDGFMKSMFDNSYLMVGNHDTNYQGAAQLSDNAITNLWFRKQGKAYYSFDGVNSKNYVLDSGLDIDSSTMDSYRWEQIDWLAEKLAQDDPTHATVFSHIVWYNAQHAISAFADNFTKLIAAYNDHDTITLNSETYDFTGKTGHVDYVLSGHLHEDYYDTINDVLCIATDWFGGNERSFDLVLNDYDAGKVKMIRVGTGSDRTFNI